MRSGIGVHQVDITEALAQSADQRIASREVMSLTAADMLDEAAALHETRERSLCQPHLTVIEQRFSGRGGIDEMLRKNRKAGAQASAERLGKVPR